MLSIRAFGRRVKIAVEVVKLPINVKISVTIWQNLRQLYNKKFDFKNCHFAIFDIFTVVMTLLFCLIARPLGLHYNHYVSPPVRLREYVHNS